MSFGLYVITDFQPVFLSAEVMEVTQEPPGRSRAADQGKILDPVDSPKPEQHRVFLLHTMEFYVRNTFEERVHAAKNSL